MTRNALVTCRSMYRPKSVMACFANPPAALSPIGFGRLFLNDANRLVPHTSFIRPRWRNFDVLEWLAFPSDRIYLGPLYFLPLLQNCTSECADGYGRARFPRPIALVGTVIDGVTYP